MDDFSDFKQFEIDGDNTNSSVDFTEMFSSNYKIDIPKKIIEYDNYTTEKYRVMRKRKMDPITYTELEDKFAFKFYWKWDPYTGERLEQDEDGPLCFDPDILIKYFHTKRLDKLWVKPADEHDGLFSGYYDDGVGAGEDFHLIGRGFHPEWYLFRLPIVDCYLSKDHNKQIITFGPKLTDSEIKEIDRLATLRPDNYKNFYMKRRPSLMEIKRLYDIAISKTPSVENIEAVPYHKLSETYSNLNRCAVDSIIKIAG
jgi:hypothetical protein